MPRINMYLAGPMTGYPEYNYPAFHAVAQRFRAAGFTVLSPAEDEYETQLTAPLPENAEHKYGYYLRLGIEKLLKADVVHMLKGWQNSTGATLEHNIAQKLGLSITYEEPPTTLVDT
ncbi:hypothetical protein N24_1839 [Corynebacterium suranareeae]|uniref:DUF4406 domain-containing protein n=1 Tax=Corynebacterium suranareeae TaxID=2506452 RepID=A0A160PSZ8_9CORY|nr:DUF4406 domain-containing protein [Corynebacterium suranareeae]BAU96101.1 hypothetical protein N24_1839 [Corynebacterium suranareeae]